MNVCYVFDKGYLGQFKVAAYSLAINNRDEHITFYLLVQSLGEEERADIADFMQKIQASYHIYEMTDELFVGLPKIRGESYSTYMKLFIPDHFSSLDRMLYLDCDIIVRKSLLSFYHMEMDEPIAAVEDVYLEHDKPEHIEMIVGKGEKYFNGGVLLFNFHAQNHPSFDAMSRYARENVAIIDYNDQDILNYCYLGHVHFVSDSYNYIASVTSIKDIFRDRKRQAVVHYAASKPWSSDYNKKFYRQYLKYYKKCAKLTPLSFLQKRKPMFLLLIDFIKKKRNRSQNK